MRLLQEGKYFLCLIYFISFGLWLQNAFFANVIPMPLPGEFFIRPVSSTDPAIMSSSFLFHAFPENAWHEKRAVFCAYYSKPMSRPSFRILSIIKYRMHHYFILFNCVKYREWKSPYWAAAEIPISNLVHLWIGDNVLYSCLNTIKKIETKAPPLSFIPGKGQFQIVS